MSVARKHPLAHCESCPLQEEGKYVPSDWQGNETAPVVFVGEAPGANEAKKGKPFVGASGQLLDATLAEHGLDRKDAMLTNTVLCRPRGNATPDARAARACAPRLWAEIEKADPYYVVALGKTAASAIMGHDVKITQERVGPPKRVEGKPFKVIPTVHPAACLRNTNLFGAFAGDLKKLTRSATITWEPPKWKAIDNATQARAAISQLLQKERADILVLDLEVGQDKDVDFGHPNTLLAAGIGYEPGKVVVLGRDALRSNAVRRDLATLFDAKKLVCHNGKYDLGVLHSMGIGTFPLHADTMLMSYTQDEVPGTHGLKYLAKEHLGAPDWDKALKEAGGFDGAPLPVLYEYNAYDVGCTWDLMEMFQGDMDTHDKRLHEFLCRASDQLMLIEAEGIYIDTAALDELEREMMIELSDMKVAISRFINENVVINDARIKKLIEKNNGYNPNSVDQTRYVLEQLLNATVTTTDAEFLEYLSGKSGEVKRFADLMLDWRKVGKLYGTYVKGTKLRLEDGRIHTSFLLHGTETGRLSSRNPNVQNVPRGPKIRSLYAAEPGNIMVYADYGNVEGRIVSVLADDENMQSVLRDPNRDIHGEVAAMFYGDEYTKEQRTVAKSVVHGANYARTPEGIAQGLGCSLSEAKKVYNAYHRLFPNVKVWQASIKQQVLGNDYEPLVTPWGRKRRFGLITRDNTEDVYKEALAFQPQSIGSDLCLEAGIELKKQGLHVRVLIHDGILVECPKEDAEFVAAHMREVMEAQGPKLTDKVPFPVDIEMGRSWGEVD